MAPESFHRGPERRTAPDILGQGHRDFIESQHFQRLSQTNHTNNNREATNEGSAALRVLKDTQHGFSSNSNPHAFPGPYVPFTVGAAQSWRQSLEPSSNAMPFTQAHVPQSTARPDPGISHGFPSSQSYNQYDSRPVSSCQPGSHLPKLLDAQLALGLPGRNGNEVKHSKSRDLGQRLDSVDRSSGGIPQGGLYQKASYLPQYKPVQPPLLSTTYDSYSTENVTHPGHVKRDFLLGHPINKNDCQAPPSNSANSQFSSIQVPSEYIPRNKDSGDFSYTPNLEEFKASAHFPTASDRPIQHLGLSRPARNFGNVLPGGLSSQTPPSATTSAAELLRYKEVLDTMTLRESDPFLDKQNYEDPEDRLRRQTSKVQPGLDTLMKNRVDGFQVDPTVHFEDLLEFPRFQKIHAEEHASPTPPPAATQLSEKPPAQPLVPSISQPLRYPRTSSPSASGIRLVNPKQSIPDRFCSVFPYELFNAVQSKCFETIYETNENVVVSAPTGSGKTALLELAICRLASQKDSENVKVVYLAPTKALCKEKATQWRKTFGILAMPVSELTGDTSRSEMRNVREAKIIVTTPEKWDSITRSWADHRRLLDLVGLLLIDEVHILKESRGATLEAVVSRMKTYGSNIRFVALSATIPNSADVAIWLGKNHASPHLPSCREVFGEEFRPVRLEKKVYGIESKLGDHPFDNILNAQLWKYLEMHSQRKPMLVFCMTRKSCYEAAKQLAREWSQREPRARLWPEPRRKFVVANAQLQDLVQYGVAFHHAGLDADDRRAVHEAFEQGNLSVICCTSTLAVGVNLPCHTVLLKGTVCYQDGQICEYSDLEVMQMLGRAGRPQFEDSALAIILTRTRNKKRYEELGSGQQVLESTLHKNLIEHFNSEVSLETFKDARGARNWLQKTFLSVRLRQNPKHYNTLTEGSNFFSADDLLRQICDLAISKLLEARLIEGNSERFRSTDYGRAMSKYMIRFETMKQIMAIPYAASTPDMLNALCETDEFGDCRWQANEKDIFREVNSDHFIMYPINTTVSTVAHKVSLLIQMELGHADVKVNGLERQRLRSEARRVLEVMHRLIRAVIECKGVDLDGKSCWTALELARSMSAKAWEGKAMQLLQVPQVGPVLMRKLVANNIRTVAHLANTDTGTIERIASRNPPFGKKIVDALVTFPTLVLDVNIKDKSTDIKGAPLLHIDAILSFTNKKGEWQGRMPIVTFMAVTTNGFPTYFWRDSLRTFKEQNGTSFQVHFTWSPTELQETLQCHFACEEIVGTVVSKEIKHGMSATAFPPKPIEFLKLSSQDQVLQQQDPEQSIIDDEVLEDDDLLGLIDNTPKVVKATQNDDEFDTDEDIFALIDRTGKIVEQTNELPGKANKDQKAKKPQQKDTEPRTEPAVIKLPNGRYKCGHSCSHFGGTKELGDRDCGHACCHIGNKNPPQKRRANNKRKEPDNENEEAEIETRPSQSKSKPPPAKRAKASESNSKPKVQQPAPRMKQPVNWSNNPQSRDFDYLDSLDMDDEGLMDLTKDGYDSDDSMQMGNVAASRSKSQSQASKPEFKTKYLFDDLLDDDFEGVDFDGGPITSAGKDSAAQGYELNSDEYEADLAAILELEPLCVDNKLGRPEDDEDDDLGDVATLGSGSVSREEVQAKGDLAFCENKTEDCVSTSRRAKDHFNNVIEQGGSHVLEHVDANTFTGWEKSTAESSLESTVSLRDERPQRETKLQGIQCDNKADGKKLQNKPADEPSWLNEFDPDLVDEFRGVVDFI